MLSSRRNRIILAAAVIVVAAVGAAALFLVDDDDEDEAAAVATSTTSTTFADLTSTTAAADTTTTTAATTTTTGKATTTTTTRPATTTTTRATTTTVAAATCGTGRATVQFAAKDLVTDALSSSFTPQAIVNNQVSEAIVVEQITVEVLYPAGEVRTVNFTTTGTVIGSGTTASFTADRLTSAKQYEGARFTRFTYYSENRPDTCRVTTP